MVFRVSKIKRNIYKIFDKVLESGVPIEIIRKGKKLRIVPVDSPDKLSNLKERNVLNDDPESIVHLDWSAEWKM